ncbi:uncharacterized protein LOC124112061 [Haliotis rufescens]|uniref:uncharacterized protein LOC124112061 n=1 Tax=Haliotis rufescens TaxID=6454 RepID=UPI00201FA318|nr:uncharacterized protein LOC124112061 [Haliotis rufescens]XP_046327951.2 uncharacterized protein LOC124112061 [Haliotis rufescens]XP_048242251.1 uncharacterized protein LOC124112061 [Haliotis rufescens]
MLLFVAAIITLSCLPVSVLSDPAPRDALLYRVDIYVPPEEGRNETADIQQVKETVKSLTDIKVLFSFKELGNPRIILVLDVEKACSWPQLTGFLSSKGYEFSVTSLYGCSDFAKEIGISLPKDIWSSSLGNVDLVMDRKIYRVGDLTTLEYNEMLQWMFERDVVIRKTVQRKKACFKSLADFPVEVMYFGQASQYVMDVMEGYLHGPRYFQNELTRIEQLDDYTGSCHK